MISPTVGRVVLFHPNAHFLGTKPAAGEPLPALVSRVWNDRLINIGGFDADGKPFNATSVQLLQDDDISMSGGHYAEWMPYQKGQAAKTEALEEKAETVNDQAIEQEIQAKGLTAPRITLLDIEAQIAERYYFTAAKAISSDGVWEPRPPSPLQTLTFCVLVLKNGFTVTGESSCASPENFDPDVGRNIARQNAMQKVWPLMGYALKEKIARDTKEAHTRQVMSGHSA